MSSQVKQEQTVTKSGSMPSLKVASPVRKRVSSKSKPLSKEGNRGQLEASKGESSLAYDAIKIKKRAESVS
jgi:hypothetical protein